MTLISISSHHPNCTKFQFVFNTSIVLRCCCCCCKMTRRRDEWDIFWGGASTKTTMIDLPKLTRGPRSPILLWLLLLALRNSHPHSNYSITRYEATVEDSEITKREWTVAVIKIEVVTRLPTPSSPNIWWLLLLSHMAFPSSTISHYCCFQRHQQMKGWQMQQRGSE